MRSHAYCCIEREEVRRMLLHEKIRTCVPIRPRCQSTQRSTTHVTHKTHKHAHITQTPHNPQKAHNAHLNKQDQYVAATLTRLIVPNKPQHSLKPHSQRIESYQTASNPNPMNGPPENTRNSRERRKRSSQSPKNTGRTMHACIMKGGWRKRDGHDSSI